MADTCCCGNGYNFGDCYPGQSCGAPDGVIPIQTVDANPSQGVAQNANGNNNTAALFNNLSLLGLTIASAVTDRPVVQQGTGVNKINTLGSKPFITGQVTAQSILVVIGLGLVAFLVIKGVK